MAVRLWGALVALAIVLVVAASWPLAAAHQVEAHWWRHHLPPSLHKGPAPLGVTHLPEAFDGAGTWTSVAGLTCVAAFAVLQVVLFIGAGGGASGGDGRKLAPVFPLNWFSCTLILVANPRMRLAHSVLIPRRILPVDHESDQLPAEEVFGVVTPERYIPSSRRDGTRCPRDLS